MAFFTSRILKIKLHLGLQFTKSDGCNKMTWWVYYFRSVFVNIYFWSRCGQTQCYLCRQTGINYSHFCHHVRNPGVQKCNQCVGKTCTIWEDAKKRDEEEINKILAEVGVPKQDVTGWRNYYLVLCFSVLLCIWFLLWSCRLISLSNKYFLYFASHRQRIWWTFAETIFAERNFRRNDNFAEKWD